MIFKLKSKLQITLGLLAPLAFTLGLSSCGGEKEEDASLSELFLAGDDPFAAEQWHLSNTGQRAYSDAGGVAGEDLNLEIAHAGGSFGASVRVAVSDTGVEIAHEDLVDRILAGESRNYLLPAPWVGDPTPDDEDGSAAHGTAVAGIIGATGWNGIGTRGVAPLVSLAGIKFLGVDVTVAQVLDQADGDFDIFNYSYGMSQCQVSGMEPGLLATLQAGGSMLRDGKGALYIKSAGNEYISDLEDCSSSLAGIPYLGNSNLDQSNTVPEVLVVGALNADGVSSSYSSPGSNIWVSAPGGEYGTGAPAIVTTDIAGCSRGFATDLGGVNLFESGNHGNGNCDYTSAMNGTSSAAPMVSGAVALLLGAYPELTWRDVKYILARSARKVDANAAATSHPLGADLNGHVYEQGWITNGAGIPFHNWYGFGGVDVDAALARAASHAALGTYVEATPVSSGTLNLALPDDSTSGLAHSLSFSSSLLVESVVVTVTVSHSAATDLGIELVSPAGTKSILMNINSQMIDSGLSSMRLLSNAFLDENAQGSWTLKVIDGAAADTGSLTRWSLGVNGRAP